MASHRADACLARSGLVTDIKAARGLIMAAKVMYAPPGKPERKVDKPGDRVDPEGTFRLLGQKDFVSRGGYKLDAALDAFGVDVRDTVCGDFGVSTGGFTDCLLRRGASRVIAIDVGYGQCDWAIRQDPRVELHERTNARLLDRMAFGVALQLAVADLSFIKLADVLPAMKDQLAPDGGIVALIKPQFELPKGEIGSGGVVQEAADQQRAVDSVVDAAEALGLENQGTIRSPIKGADGNVEFLIHLTC